ncbi:hypothetical protein D3C76_723210 [compost metagenome]
MVAVDADRLMHVARSEVRGEGIGHAAHAGQLGAEQAGTEQPDRHVGAIAGHGDDFLLRSPRPQVAHQLFDIVRKIVSTAGAFTTQGTSGHLVRTRRTPQAQVDTTGIEAFQGAKLLGNHQRRMVGQHDATGTDADGRSATGQVTEQHSGGRAGDAVHVVVLGDPEAVVAEFFHVLRQVQRVAQGLRRAAVGTHRDQVEGGKFDVCKSLHGQLSLLGSQLAGIARWPF